MLQHGGIAVGPTLCKLFRASLAFGYIPESWRPARVVFIFKAGNMNANSAKGKRPISLTSFALKALEKLVDMHIREEGLKRNPLHAHQYAYQSGKSGEMALQNLVGKMSGTIEKKQIALGAFLDIEGAFNNTTHDSIIAAAGQHGVEPTICR